MSGLSSDKDSQLVATKWKKWLINIFLLIIISFLLGVFSWVISFMIPMGNTNVSQYLGSAVLQSFAALIAIPFTFYASYLYSKYGMVGLQFAIDRVKTRILPLFSLVALFSILLMTRNIPNNYSPIFHDLLPEWFPSPRYLGWGRVFMFFLIAFSFVLLWQIYNHLVEIMNATPFVLMDKIVKLNEKNKKRNLETLKKKYRLTLDLAYASLRDPRYYTDLIMILKELQKFFEKFIPENDVKEDMMFAYDVIKQFNVTLGRELEKTGPIISTLNTSEFVEALSKLVFKSILWHAKEIDKHSSLSSDLDPEIIKSLRLTIKEFYNGIHQLSTVYKNNFYVGVKKGILDVEREIKHDELDKELKLLYQIKARLIQECYFYIEAAMEDKRSYREKLEIISEFNVFKLILDDQEIDNILRTNDIIILDLKTNLWGIHKILEDFIKNVNELIKQGEETEENRAFLCEISKPILSAIISLVDYVLFKSKSEEEESILLDYILSRISQDLVQPSLDLLKVSKAKAKLFNEDDHGSFYVECALREAPNSYFDVGDLFEYKTDPHTLKEFLENVGLEEYVEINC